MCDTKVNIQYIQGKWHIINEYTYLKILSKVKFNTFLIMEGKPSPLTFSYEMVIGTICWVKVFERLKLKINVNHFAWLSLTDKSHIYLYNNNKMVNFFLFTPQPLRAVWVLFSPMVSGWAGG